MPAIGLHPVTRAAIWMSGALLSLAAMAVATRELSAYLSIFQILFFRSACGVLVISAILWRSGWRQIITPDPVSHLIRNIGHFGAQYAWIYGIIFIPMAEVFAIEFTAPVWTIFLAALILKEKITWPRGISVLTGLTGVYLIVQPGSAMVHPASLAVLVGAMAFALAYTMTKKLSRTDTALCILFYMSVIQLPLGAVTAALDWRPIDPACWPLILVVGIVGLTAHYCMAKAMQVADATIVVPMDFLRLPLIAVIGTVFYAETVKPSLFIGAALILGGNLFSIVMERRRIKAAEA
ncbi:EamA family transporter [Pollutimonas thiosulfatoxidans]|uniref:EamA family transporter n=2 Tax=Pollutimonas thiosulfatoxidans TaxID=2028345 RepID=A0A410GGE8_9BURK|nr:EamA family transporter [Pollutimonas thiosulfatoxidans]